MLNYNGLKKSASSKRKESIKRNKSRGVGQKCKIGRGGNEKSGKVFSSHTFQKRDGFERGKTKQGGLEMNSTMSTEKRSR